MDLVKETKEHKIYQKKSKRYAVRDANRKWVNGEEKVKILVKEKLLKVPIPKPAPKEEKPKAAEKAPEAAEEEKPAE